MGEREFGTKLYYQLSLDGLVHQDHLLRRIARAVDFAFVRRLCRAFYSHTGQPSVDPVVIFKMLLIGYLYGITSERRQAQEVSLHLAYRWFLGYDFDVSTPDQSVLSKARTRLGSEVFETTPQLRLNLQKAFELRVAEIESGRVTATRVQPRGTVQIAGSRNQ